MTVPLAFYTTDPDTEQEVMYTDCADVPIEVTLSNNKDFTLLPQPSKMKICRGQVLTEVFLFPRERRSPSTGLLRRG